MATNGQPIEYRVVLHRSGPKTGMFEAPGFTVVIQAKDAEDAARQAQEVAARHNGKYRVVEIRPAGGTSVGNDFLSLPPPWLPT